MNDHTDTARDALDAFLTELPEWFDQVTVLNAAATAAGPCFELSRHVGDNAHVYIGHLFSHGWADVSIDRNPQRIALTPTETAAIVRALEEHGYLERG